MLPRLGVCDAGSIDACSARTLRVAATPRRHPPHRRVHRTRPRGCKHRCRHCPIVPVYDGQFRVVPVDVVLADVAQQVAPGAAHITFGDPDFFNGPTHARAHRRSAACASIPRVTYDVTIKVEHLLRIATCCRVLARPDALFVTSAVEAVDDARARAAREGPHARRLHRGGRALPRRRAHARRRRSSPSRRGLTLDGYRDLLETVARLGSRRARRAGAVGDSPAGHRQDRGCWSWRTCARASARSIARR